MLWPSSSSYHLLFSITLPPPPFPILFRIFILCQISFLGQILSNFGIWYSSPTLHSAPFTFLLALISRMERVDIRAKSSWAKSMGTIASIIGALTVTLYKGLPLFTNPLFHDTNNTNLLNKFTTILTLSTSHEAHQQSANWVIGGTILAASALCHSFLQIVRTWIMRDYPQELMATLLCCTFVTFQSTLVALVFEKAPNAWALKLDLE